jgi:hypothetical protein
MSTAAAAPPASTSEALAMLTSAMRYLPMPRAGCSGARPGSTSQRSEASFHVRGSALPRCNAVASLRSASQSCEAFRVASAGVSGVRHAEVWR